MTPIAKAATAARDAIALAQRKRTMERELRAAGCSRSAAKEIASKHFTLRGKL